MNIRQLHKILEREIANGCGDLQIVIKIDGSSQHRRLYPSMFPYDEYTFLIQTYPQDINNDWTELREKIERANRLMPHNS